MIRDDPTPIAAPAQSGCWLSCRAGIYRSDALCTLQIDPRVAAFNLSTAQSLSLAEPLHRRDPAQVRSERSAWSAARARADATWITVEAHYGVLRLRHLPGEIAGGPRCLHVHGGGWVLGGADRQDDWLQDLATRTEAVYSVEYRLAPEHPFPAALDDVTDALRWLIEHDGERCAGLVVCGESAGANLLVGAMLRLRDTGSIGAVRGAFLNSGTYDLTGSPRLRATAAEGTLLSWPLVQWFVTHYGVTERLRDPEVSPVFARLDGLPQTLLLAGSEDPALDDSLLLEARLRAAGTPAIAAVVAGGLHGMIELRTPVTRLAREVVLEGLDRVRRGLGLCPG